LERNTKPANLKVETRIFMLEIMSKNCQNYSNILIENPNPDVSVINCSNITIDAHSSSFNDDAPFEEVKVDKNSRDINPF